MGFDKSHKLDTMFAQQSPDYAQSPDIKWNFTKFLIDWQGQVVVRFELTADMTEVAAAVKDLL